MEPKNIEPIERGPADLPPPPASVQAADLAHAIALLNAYRELAAGLQEKVQRAAESEARSAQRVLDLLEAARRRGGPILVEQLDIEVALIEVERKLNCPQESEA